MHNWGEGLMEEDDPKIDLSRFRNHSRKIPWGLIRKIIIGISAIGLLYYFTKELNEPPKKEKTPLEFEVEIES